MREAVERGAHVRGVGLDRNVRSGAEDAGRRPAERSVSRTRLEHGVAADEGERGNDEPAAAERARRPTRTPAHAPFDGRASSKRRSSPKAASAGTTRARTRIARPGAPTLRPIAASTGSGGSAPSAKAVARAAHPSKASAARFRIETRPASARRITGPPGVERPLSERVDRRDDLHAAAVASENEAGRHLARLVVRVRIAVGRIFGDGLLVRLAEPSREEQAREDARLEGLEQQSGARASAARRSRARVERREELDRSEEEAQRGGGEDAEREPSPVAHRDPAQEERGAGVDGEHERPDHGEQREPGEVLQRERRGERERPALLPAGEDPLDAREAQRNPSDDRHERRVVQVRGGPAGEREPERAEGRGARAHARREEEHLEEDAGEEDVEGRREEEEVERLEERGEKVRRIERRRERVRRVRHAAQDRVVPERDLAVAELFRREDAIGIEQVDRVGHRAVEGLRFEAFTVERVGKVAGRGVARKEGAPAELDPGGPGADEHEQDGRKQPDRGPLLPGRHQIDLDLERSACPRAARTACLGLPGVPNLQRRLGSVRVCERASTARPERHGRGATSSTPTAKQPVEPSARHGLRSTAQMQAQGVVGQDQPSDRPYPRRHDELVPRVDVDELPAERSQRQGEEVGDLAEPSHAVDEERDRDVFPGAALLDAQHFEPRALEEGRDGASARSDRRARAA